MPPGGGGAGGRPAPTRFWRVSRGATRREPCRRNGAGRVAMKPIWALSGAAVVLAWMIGAAAQERVVQRSVKGTTGKDVQVGAYINVLPDCSSGPLPTIRLVKPPAHAQVTVK